MCFVGILGINLNLNPKQYANSNSNPTITTSTFTNLNLITRMESNGMEWNTDMSQSTSPTELPILGSVSLGEIELRIESETHKYFHIQDKRLRLTRPLDRDAIMKEVSRSFSLYLVYLMERSTSSTC